MNCNSINIQHASKICIVDFVNFEEIFNQIPQDAYWITDSKIYSLWQNNWPKNLNWYVLPSDERTKSFESYLQCIEWLFSQNADRNTTLVALGGGVITDLVGYVASSYKRGVNYYAIPTTLLGQVDASIGGKVGINLRYGKNLIGSFYPPEKILLCLDFLETLDLRQFNSGSAEIWKYAFIYKPELLHYLMDQPLRTNSKNLYEIIHDCISIKKHYIEIDEFDRTDQRSQLNFGHTIGHAIESVSGYQSLYHGEAISIGMILETILSEKIGISEPGLANQIKSGLSSQGLPSELPFHLDRRLLMEAIKHDKKNSKQNLAFSLLSTFGQCKLYKNIDPNDVFQVLNP